MKSDQRREQQKELRQSEEFMRGIKIHHLIIYREERDRAVAEAKSKAAQSLPLDPPGRPESENVKAVPHTLPTAGSDPPPESPDFVSGIAQATNSTVRAVIDGLRSFAPQTTPQGALPAASSETTPAAYVALLIIALFLVPSIGISSLLIGITHLRGQSFFSGGMFLAFGALVLWVALWGSRALIPNAFAGSFGEAPAATLSETGAGR
jgi:hypothetical protein